MRNEMKNIYERLSVWRREQAHAEGVELFRILTNKTLSDIAFEIPKTPELLMSIGGFKEKKMQKYGKAILEITRGKTAHDSLESTRMENENVFTVDEYLEITNTVLRRLQSGVRGEIGDIDFRERYIFFTLKDTEHESALSCFMWQSDYRLCGVHISTGSEVIVRGFSEIYKPSGRFSFHAHLIEYVGEGMLKKEYDRLRFQLESEGVFDAKKKKTIRPFPEYIGLITSRDGAVIHDFLNNIGKFGYRIKFVNSRVEGQLAIRSLIRAIHFFQKEPLDALVIIRGGGSFESLQAFNNEQIVREITACSFPVICGIGHHQDVPLASLAADIAVSTPTAAAHELNRTWEHAEYSLNICMNRIRDGFSRYMQMGDDSIRKSEHKARIFFKISLEKCARAFQNVKKNVAMFNDAMIMSQERLSRSSDKIQTAFFHGLRGVQNKLVFLEKSVSAHDPKKLLSMGFSITFFRGKVLRSIQNIQEHEAIEVVVCDGSMIASVQNIKKDIREKTPIDL